MENIYDPMVIAVGHNNLFKRRISQDEIIQIISQHSVSQWLDLFAKIEGFLLIKQPDISNSQVFLAQNLFLESTLRRIRTAAKSNKEMVIFALGPLNLLRKLAIVYGENIVENEIPISKVDISKIILGAQDFHSDYDELVRKPEDLESFCQFIIRNGYLNNNLDVVNLFVRAYQLYVIQAQKLTFYPDKNFIDFFRENVGLSIEQTMALGFALANPFFQNKEVLLGQSTIIDLKTFFQDLDIDQSVIDSIIGGSAIDFSQVKDEISKELSVPTFSHSPIGYNLDLFRKKPLIKLDDGKLVCANLSCLFLKVTQNIIWMPAMAFPKEERRKFLNDLTNYRGRLFEEYLKSLCIIMENKNSKISFYYIRSQITLDHEEVSDSILVQGDKILIIEAKSRQFNESFKYTGDWEEDKQFINELIKKASEQIEIAAQKIRAGEVDKFPLKPEDIKLIYPVIITYEPIPMHAKMQRFIRQQVKEAGYLTDSIFAPLEIMDINDVEQFMDSAYSHTIIDLLNEKNLSGPHASETNLGNFLASFYNSHRVICNGWQKERYKKFEDKIFEPNLKFK